MFKIKIKIPRLYQRPAVLNWGVSLPPGDMWQCLKPLLVITTGVCYQIEWPEPRDADHAARQRTVPPAAETDPGAMLSAEEEKLCPGHTELCISGDWLKSSTEKWTWKHTLPV